MKYLILIILVFLSGCGMKTSSIESGERAVQRAEKINELYKKETKAFLESSLYNKHINSAKRENLEQKMNDIQKYVIEVENSKIKINDYLKKDSSDEENNLLIEINKVNTTSMLIENNIKALFQRLNMYDTFEENKDKYIARMEDFSLKLQKSSNELIDISDFMSKKYANRVKDIQDKTLDIINDNKSLIMEISLLNSKDLIDFLVIYDNVQLNGENIVKEVNLLIKNIASLDISYIKIVKESKKVSFAIPKIFTWDEGSDSSGSEETLSKIQIDNNSADLIEKNNIEQVAKYNKSWVGRNFNCLSDNALCKNFEYIAEQGLYIRNSHDHGEIWIEDMEYQFYINYITIEGNTTKETGLLLVSEEEYEDNGLAVGKEVYSKQLGFFEEEASEAIVPVGMGFVGNQKYGEWKQDNSGNSFWHYYGQYAMISNLMDAFGTNRYSQDSYNKYRQENSGGGTVITNKSGESIRGNTKNVNAGKTLRGVGSSTRGRGSNGGGK